MPSTEPAQLAALRDLIGLTEDNDNPKVTALVRFVGDTFPEMKAYSREYTSPTGQAWCGGAQGYAFAKIGLRPPFGPTDYDKFLWAQSWKQFGTRVASPQLGDIMVLARHVTQFAGTRDGKWIGLGGNQGNSIRESLYDPDTIEEIRRPPLTAVASKPVPFVPLDATSIMAVVNAAEKSEIASYSWADRGRAPIGYTKGLAVAYGQALRKLAAQAPEALAMVRIVEDGHDVFDHYQLGTLNAAPVDRLRALFTVLFGLGMRESSGNCFEGRDMSANNVSADSAEAGLFQMSWDLYTLHKSLVPELPALLDAYEAEKFNGFLYIFREGVSGGPTPSTGEGQGAIFQATCKSYPAFAVEAAAIGLRKVCTHWGPINRKEVEIRSEATALLKQVETIINVNRKETPVADNAPIVNAPAIPVNDSGSNNFMTNAMLYFAQNPEAFARIQAFLRFARNGGAPDTGGVSGSTPATSGAPPAVPTVPALPKWGLGTGILGTLISAVLMKNGTVAPALGDGSSLTGLLSVALPAALAAFGHGGGPAAILAKLAPTVFAALAKK